MKKVKIQEQFQEFIDDNYVFVFDVQSDSKATEPLLHKYSRFLYVFEGKGKININNKIYKLEPDTVIQMLLGKYLKLLKWKKSLFITF